MLQARRLVPLAMAVALAAPLAGVTAGTALAAKREAGAAAAAPAKRAGYRQFTGTVVALDASTITVEKGGKAPKQMVFARHAGMRSTGDVARDVRVTVYWRDEAGKPVAHRVVVKPATDGGGR